jgi:hypothetical protein
MDENAVLNLFRMYAENVVTYDLYKSMTDNTALIFKSHRAQSTVRSLAEKVWTETKQLDLGLNSDAT